MVQVGGRDDDVGVGEEHLALRPAVLDALDGLVAHEDLLDGRVGDDRHALLAREGGDALDDAGEAADRVEHAVLEIEVAHQVVHARGLVR